MDIAYSLRSRITRNKKKRRKQLLIVSAPTTKRVNSAISPPRIAQPPDNIKKKKKARSSSLHQIEKKERKNLWEAVRLRDNNNPSGKGRSFCQNSLGFGRLRRRHLPPTSHYYYYCFFCKSFSFSVCDAEHIVSKDSSSTAVNWPSVWWVHERPFFFNSSSIHHFPLLLLSILTQSMHSEGGGACK